MIVAVTGARGHVGANLVQAVLSLGDGVRALVRGDAGPPLGTGAAVVHGDARDPRALDALLEGADRLFNLAATVSIDPRDDAGVASNNVAVPRAVAAACLARGIRMVHVSSIHALQSAHGPIDETAPLAIDHPFAYDRSKALGEREVLAGVERGLDAVIVNPTAVIGPLDHRPSHMGRFLLQLARGRLPCLVQGGFDWVDARDVARGILAAAERGRRGERYLLPGAWRSVRDLAEVARAVAGVRPPRLQIPIGAAKLGVPFAAAYARLTGTKPLFTGPALEALRHHRDVRGDKAARELGHTARPLEETVRDTLDWFETAGAL